MERVCGKLHNSLKVKVTAQQTSTEQNTTDLVFLHYEEFTVSSFVNFTI